MSDKPRALRNKTLTMTEKEITNLRKNILYPNDLAPATNFENKTINGNLFDVIKYIPDNFADLIIIDPPYNLTKNFNGLTFAQMSDSNYDEYLESWFHNVCKKLKSNGSLYMCGDWKCTSALQRIIEKELTIINRITWQREKGRGAKKNWKNAMEDIWFAVKNPKNYYFNVDAVMSKRKVLAPYKIDGKPKDWEETAKGNYRITCPSNFWDDISIPFWSMPENTDHPTQKPEKLYAKLILASSILASISINFFNSLEISPFFSIKGLAHKIKVFSSILSIPLSSKRTLSSLNFFSVSCTNFSSSFS